jgi:DNA repair photolyase
MPKNIELIERKSLLRPTKVEYADYAINHVQGCSHGCLYPCYAFKISQKYGVVRTYEEWCEPKVVGNAMELLEREIPRLRDKIGRVYLCFMTDPFMHQREEIHATSQNIILALNQAGIPVTVLTKGVLPLNLSTLSRENEYGITLVSLDEKFREKYEPGAAPLEERLRALRDLKSQGCRTWISIEPYPTPGIWGQDLRKILCGAAGAADKIVFGAWNYNLSLPAHIDRTAFYKSCKAVVHDFCREFDIDWHFKKGT